jgi:hypothetical protein
MITQKQEAENEILREAAREVSKRLTTTDLLSREGTAMKPTAGSE